MVFRSITVFETEKSLLNCPFIDTIFTLHFTNITTNYGGSIPFIECERYVMSDTFVYLALHFEDQGY